ncbi:hypothetical protein COCSUDRAFT_61060 [Coccomyxa subellipsoidea C-169]|uniref:BZIP domain-containing protein n=1 Tax=Coccomyxa subellipsoidea (strain C-169) TaxID=574566 RepID=I0Z5Z5_COCSC|nr:hypothetical protein COCSUDRAFT_61060 [Coccomyxa subellipsoidea C-169]EIE26064.1 hypothetical protein COCSUDRAFT_61060 [Coccomyxa subellipsoidea C-169]|eukprot:XP_005650608.1 hypothetical protein COCSUDRAFT_61060 [Coccomyxa subellipsoidea C-169]
MPQIMPSEFLGEPGLDAEIMVGLPQDHASSNSGEYSNEHNGAPLGEPVAHQRSSSAEEHEKSAQRAARVAEKNRRAQKRFREREKMKKATLESQVAELTTKLAALSQEKNRLENRNNILEKVVKLKDEYITDLESKGPKLELPPAQSNLNEALHDFYKVVMEGPCPHNDGGNIPMSAIQKTHKAYIDALAKALVEGAEDPTRPAHKRMCDLVRADRAVMARIGLLSDKLYMIVASQQVMPLDKPIGRPDMQHWKGVLDTVNLSMSQKEAVLAARHDLLSRMGSIVADRQPLVQGIAANAEGGDFSKQYERREMIEQLQNNLKEEYRAVFDFEVALYQTILKPLQQARMQVASYPWPVDSLAICGLIAAERQSREAGGSFEEGAQQMEADYSSLLTGLPEKSPFRMLAAPMPVL